MMRSSSKIGSLLFFLAATPFLSVTDTPLSIVNSCHAEDPAPEDAKEASANDPLEIVPTVATASIMIRDFAELSDRGDKLIEKTQIRVPMRFSDGYRFLISFLGIRNGIDVHGSAALFQLPGAKDFNGLALVVPMKDAATMAANFNVPAEKMVPGRVINVNNFGKTQATLPFIAVRGKHLVMGFDRDVVQKSVKGPTLSESLSEKTKRTLSRDDVLLFIRGELAKENFGPVLQPLFSSMDSKSDAITKTIDELEFITAGIRLENGIGGTLVLGFDGDRSQAYLERLAQGTSKASMIGLPDGQLVASHSSGGDGDDSAFATQVLLQTLMAQFSFSMNQMSSEVQRSKLMSVFNEAWQRADGSCSALYQNTKPQEMGAFSLITILRTDDGNGFVRDMSDLIPFVNSTIVLNETPDTIDDEAIEDFIDQLAHPRYRVRQLASTKLTLIGEPALPLLQTVADARDPEVRARVQEIIKRIQQNLGAERKALLEGNLLSRLEPQLSYSKGRETRAGRKVDFMTIQLLGNDRSKADDMKRLFGPGWQTIRLVVVENDVVVLLGSDTSLIEKAIQHLEDGTVGIPDERFAPFRDRATKRPKVEFHIGLALAEKLMTGKTPASDDTQAKDFTSIGVTVTPKQIRMDAFSPYKDVKSLAKRMGWSNR